MRDIKKVVNKSSKIGEKLMASWSISQKVINVCFHLFSKILHISPLNLPKKSKDIKNSFVVEREKRSKIVREKREFQNFLAIISQLFSNGFSTTVCWVMALKTFIFFGVMRICAEENHHPLTPIIVSIMILITGALEPEKSEA